MQIFKDLCWDQHSRRVYHPNVLNPPFSFIKIPFPSSHKNAYFGLNYPSIDSKLFTLQHSALPLSFFYEKLKANSLQTWAQSGEQLHCFITRYGCRWNVLRWAHKRTFPDICSTFNSQLRDEWAVLGRGGGCKLSNSTSWLKAVLTCRPINNRVPTGLILRVAVTVFFIFISGFLQVD